MGLPFQQFASSLMTRWIEGRHHFQRMCHISLKRPGFLAKCSTWIISKMPQKKSDHHFQHMPINLPKPHTSPHTLREVFINRILNVCCSQHEDQAPAI